MRILHRGNEDVLGVGMLRIQCRRRQKEWERRYMLLVRTGNHELAAVGSSGNAAGLTYKGNTGGVITADSQLLGGLAAYA